MTGNSDLKGDLEHRKGWDSFPYIFLSFAGLFLLLFLILRAPLARPFYGPWVLVLFILICVLGGLAACYPRQCAGIFRLRKDTVDLSVKTYQGHHPDCKGFQNHVLIIRGKRYCAGCTGLFMGAVVAILVAIIYYLYSFLYLISFNGKIGIYIGAGAVFLSLFILFMNKTHVWGKFTANFILVVGSLLLLLGMYNLKTSLIIQLYFLGLILLWIVSRREVSQENHDQICEKCELLVECEL